MFLSNSPKFKVFLDIFSGLLLLYSDLFLFIAANTQGVVALVTAPSVVAANAIAIVAGSLLSSNLT